MNLACSVIALSSYARLVGLQSSFQSSTSWGSLCLISHPIFQTLSMGNGEGENGMDFVHSLYEILEFLCPMKVSPSFLASSYG
jgi:hypothetical protein